MLVILGRVMWKENSGVSLGSVDGAVKSIEAFLLDDIHRAAYVYLYGEVSYRR